MIGLHGCELQLEVELPCSSQYDDSRERVLTVCFTKLASAPAEAVGGSTKDRSINWISRWQPLCQEILLAERPPPHRAARQDGLAYVIREADANAWEFWGCVLYFGGKHDSPSNVREVVYETSEKYDTYYSNVYGIMPGMCHLSRRNIAQSLIMKEILTLKIIV